MLVASEQLHSIAARLTDVWFVGAIPSTKGLAQEVAINTSLYPDAESQLADIVDEFRQGEDISTLRSHGRFGASARGGAYVKGIRFLTLNDKMVLRFSRKAPDEGFVL